MKTGNNETVPEIDFVHMSTVQARAEIDENKYKDIATVSVSFKASLQWNIGKPHSKADRRENNSAKASIAQCLSREE